MANFKGCPPADIHPAKRIYEVDGILVVLVNLDGEFYAVEDTCTHDGGPLGEGECRTGTLSALHGARWISARAALRCLLLTRRPPTQSVYKTAISTSSRIERKESAARPTEDDAGDNPENVFDLEIGINIVDLGLVYDEGAGRQERGC